MRTSRSLDAVRAALDSPSRPQPIPIDLEPISIAMSLAKVSRNTIRAWHRRGLIRLWGHPGAYRVSMAEILQATSVAPRTSAGVMQGDGKRAKAEANALLRDILREVRSMRLHIAKLCQATRLPRLTDQHSDYGE